MIYLTKGHSHNAADEIHGNIEVKMKKMGKIHDFGVFKPVLTDPGKELIPSVWTILSGIGLQSRVPAQKR